MLHPSTIVPVATSAYPLLNDGVTVLEVFEGQNTWVHATLYTPINPYYHLYG